MAALPTSTAVRRLAADDLPAALRLTQAQNWSHRLHDWELHLRLGRGWGVVDDRGDLLGTALWWAYGPKFGSVGLVVVRPDRQGRGIGRQLMTAVLEDAGDRSLQLQATQAGLELYRRSGFVEVGTLAQRQGVPGLAAIAPAPPDTTLRVIEAADVPALVTLDAAAVGAPRRALVTAVLEVGHGGVLAERGGQAVGYALRRPSGRGTTVGPVVATDENVAIALVAHQLGASDDFTRLDVPTSATALAAFLDAAGLPAVDHVTPMLRGPAPVGANAAARTYGLASHALG